MYIHNEKLAFYKETNLSVIVKLILNLHFYEQIIKLITFGTDGKFSF